MATRESEGEVTYPRDPLDIVVDGNEYRRRLVSGVLESYNSNYDFLAEAVQNAVDAIEDAKIREYRRPFRLSVTINLQENYVSILDTGVGMTELDLTRALVPHVSLKADGTMIARRGDKHSYRGYKGVGLTLLAYGTDDLRLHSKAEGEELVALRMRYGNAWARGDRQDSAMVDRDDDVSPLKRLKRGTCVRLQFSPSTRPKSLNALTPHIEAWEAILRTRTAIGQVLIGRTPLVDIEFSLTLINSLGKESVHSKPSFLFPHDVVRNPEFRFLDVGKYYEKYPQRSEIPTEFTRQDGIYIFWDTERIRAQFTESEQKEVSRTTGHLQPDVIRLCSISGWCLGGNERNPV